jgi:hypothetical protein
MEIKPLWESTLAEDLPAGPFPGQNFHPAGSTISAAVSIDTKKFGTISFVAPDPVYFYLNSAEKSLKETDSLLSKLDESKKPSLFGDKLITEMHYKVVYDYLEKAMSVFIFLYSGLEAFANQRIPTLKKYFPDKGTGRKKAYKSREEFEKKASVKHKLNIITEELGKAKLNKQDFWNLITELVHIRHEIIHLKTKGEKFTSMYNQVYSDLIDCDIQGIFSSTINLMKHIDSEF